MASETKAEFLAQIDFFTAFEQSVLQIILQTCEQKVYSSGETIFRKGDPSNGGYVVTRGRLGLYDESMKSTPVRFAGPGVLIGELALLAVTVRPVTAIAIEVSSLVHVPRGLFRRVLQENPLSAEQLRNHVSMRLATLVSDLKQIA